MEPRPLEEPLTLKQVLRFWSRVEKTRTCWLWQGKLSGGRKDGLQFQAQGRYLSARRLAWELSNPDAAPLDPRLRVLRCPDNIRCVNPDHLEIVLGGSHHRHEECKRGHDMTDEENIYYTTQGKRACRECIKVTGRARKNRYRKEGRGWGRTYTPLSQSSKKRSQVGGSSSKQKKSRGH